MILSYSFVTVSDLSGPRQFFSVFSILTKNHLCHILKGEDYYTFKIYKHLWQRVKKMLL